MSHLKKLEKKHLKPGENVVAHASGYIGKMMGRGENAQHNGILAVTPERVIFYRNGFIGEKVQTIPLRAVTSVERSSMLMYKTICIHTSHDDLKFTTHDGANEQAIASAIEMYRANPAAPAAPVVQGQPDTASRLRDLDDLLKNGIVTAEEHAAKRAEILAAL